MIIFDWDDTILPSSFVDKVQADNLSELPQHYHAIFHEIETCSEKCLAAAAKHGEVLLITNSDEGWVKYSAERYLPGLLPVLANYRIISARTRYEKFYPNQPLCWKAAAFAHEVNEHFCQLEEAHEMLDRECSHGRRSCDDDDDNTRRSGSMHHGGDHGGDRKHHQEDSSSLPDMDSASTMDDTSCEDNSISSAEADSPGRDEEWSTKPDDDNATDTNNDTNTNNDANNDDDADMASSSSPLSIPTTSQPNPPILSREIISFGDSIEERTAVKIVSDQLSALPKSVKFLHDPSPQQIVGQLTMLTHHMAFVCTHGEDLDLEISEEQAERCARGYLARRGLRYGGKGSSLEREHQHQQQQQPTILQRILGTSTSAGDERTREESGGMDMEHSI